MILAHNFPYTHISMYLKYKVNFAVVRRRIENFLVASWYLLRYISFFVTESRLESALELKENLQNQLEKCLKNKNE